MARKAPRAKGKPRCPGKNAAPWRKGAKPAPWIRRACGKGVPGSTTDGKKRREEDDQCDEGDKEARRCKRGRKRGREAPWARRACEKEAPWRATGAKRRPGAKQQRDGGDEEADEQNGGGKEGAPVRKKKLGQQSDGKLRTLGRDAYLGLSRLPKKLRAASRALRAQAIEELSAPGQRAQHLEDNGTATDATRDTRVFAVTHPNEDSVAVVAIVNGYGKGDRIQHHSDNEAQVLQDMPICTYSFGSAGTFEVRAKGHAKLLRAIRTEDGQRLVMQGKRFQRDFTHGLPSPMTSGYRLSVTVRFCDGDKTLTRNPEAHYAFKDMRPSIWWEKWPASPDASPLWRLAALCCQDALTFAGQQSC